MGTLIGKTSYSERIFCFENKTKLDLFASRFEQSTAAHHWQFIQLTCCAIYSCSPLFRLSLVSRCQHLVTEQSRVELTADEASIIAQWKLKV